MEKFNPFKNLKKTVDNSKSLIKKAIVAGSIFMIAEQGLAQTIPNTKDKYIPDKNWSFNSETGKVEATKKSLLYPGYVENYLINDDSTYSFEGYRTENGENIRTINEVEADILKQQDNIEHYNDTQKTKERIEYQSTPEYKEECYKKALEDQQKDIAKEKKIIDNYKSLLLAKDKDGSYYKKINDLIAEHEETYKGLNNYLIDELGDKEKAIENPKIVPIYTYEEIVSMFEISKRQNQQDLEKLLKEKEQTEKYISKFKENK